MYKGVIARLTDKGFGFIIIEGMEKDVFFHASSLTNIHFNDLREGDMVVCDVEEGDKGLSAMNVEVVTGEAAPATDAAPEGEATEAPAEEAAEAPAEA